MSTVAFWTFIGSILGIGLVSRLISRFAFQNAHGGRKVLLPNAGALLIGTILGGYGLADGEPPVFEKAFLTYLLPAVLWTIVDTVREEQGRPSRAARRHAIKSNSIDGLPVAGTQGGAILPNANKPQSTIEALERLGALRERGHLTVEEFSALKSDLLRRDENEAP